jgi:hypothetical protein
VVCAKGSVAVSMDGCGWKGVLFGRKLSLEKPFGPGVVKYSESCLWSFRTDTCR